MIASHLLRRNARRVITCTVFEVEDRILRLLQCGQLEQIAKLAGQNKRILSLLTALSYDPQPLVAWRAVDAFGRAANRVAQSDAEYVRNHLRRLFWLVNDESGGIGWRAPELIGETIYRCPGQFDEFVSPLVYLLDMEAEDLPPFQAGILWAIGRIAPLLKDGVLVVQQPYLPGGITWQALVLRCLAAGDAQIRGMALWCLKSLGYAGSLPECAALLDDQGRVEIYLDGEIHSTSVSSLAITLSSGIS